MVMVYLEPKYPRKSYVALNGVIQGQEYPNVA